ncbi:hypothetical protein Hanom_Chr03g00191251 [Helianthus anomalus]
MLIVYDDFLILDHVNFNNKTYMFTSQTLHNKRRAPTPIFFERQIWITDGPLEYHRATSRTTRSYPSPLGNNAYTPIQEEAQ